MTEVVTTNQLSPGGLQLLAELEQLGAIDVSKMGLTLPPDLSYEQCEAVVTMFGYLHRLSAFAIGDALNHIERVYGETYAQAEKYTGLNANTLMTYASVCAKVPRSRRNPALPFSTHQEVAPLEPDEQKRWLREAADNQWTKMELRQAIAGNPPPAAEVECICPNCGNHHAVEIETP
jgi:hypothetical protein